MTRETFEMIEIDVPMCSRTYATAPCAAALGTTGVRKCYDLRATCQDAANYLAGTPLTLRFCKPGPIPYGTLAFPTLRKVEQTSPQMNVAGASERSSQQGAHGTLRFVVGDLVYHERGIDPYQSGRVDGTAQTDEGGYDPAARGTFLPKLKARWTNYEGATVRLKRGYLVAGVLTDVTTYTYILNELDGPSGGEMTGDCADILDLSNEKRALCPKPSPGVLTLDITAVATTFNVTPAGAGASYAASGWVCIGSEIMAFTRSTDTFTVTRGQRGTTAATHSAADAVQETYSPRAMRIDAVANELLTSFTTTPASWWTYTDWQVEVTRWAPSLALTTDIVTPTPVGQLLGEFGDLGCNIVTNERLGKIVLRMDRPVDGETVYTVTDQSAKEIRQEDRDEDRITQVYYCHKRADPTKQLTDEANYLRRMLTVNPDAVALYGNSKTRRIFTRWLDQGDDVTSSVTSWRMLRRFETPPKRIWVTLDAKDKAIALLDVIDITSDDFADVTGKAVSTRFQVVGRREPIPYHDVEVEAVIFGYAGRSGFITPNTYPVYGSASAAEKAAGCWIADNTTLKFADGTSAYRII